MPKIAESVLVAYCDFCQENNQSSRAYSNCKLCGALLCYRHQTRVEFVCLLEPSNPDEEERFLDKLLGLVRASAGGTVCPECASGSTLAEVVRRLTEIMVASTPRNGGNRNGP